MYYKEVKDGDWIRVVESKDALKQYVFVKNKYTTGLTLIYPAISAGIQWTLNDEMAEVEFVPRFCIIPEEKECYGIYSNAICVASVSTIDSDYYEIYNLTTGDSRTVKGLDNFHPLPENFDFDFEKVQ